MTAAPKWESCVSHRGEAANQFLRDYFSQSDRRIVLIAGAGFDPRATQLADQLAKAANGRLSAIFLREERPDPKRELLSRGDTNAVILQQIVPKRVFGKGVVSEVIDLHRITHSKRRNGDNYADDYAKTIPVGSD